MRILFIFLTSCLLIQSSWAQNAKPEPDVERLAAAETEINVKNADLDALIRIFSKKTKRNYILDERVKGTVSIYLPGKVSADEAIHILDSVLALKGFTAVPIADNLWKIIPATEAKQTTVPIKDGSDGRGTAAVVTRFLNLKFVSAEDVQQLISSLISPYGLVSAYTGTNSLILIDSEDNINRLVEMIERIDLPSTESEMVIIPIVHATAADLAEKLQEILSSDENSSAEIPTGRRARRVAQVRQDRSTGTATSAVAATSAGGAASVSVSSRARDPKIIADERTNSIIVVADTETTNRIKALIEQLDSPIDLSGDNFYVYRCQHANAEELAEVLSGLLGESASGDDSDSTSRVSRAQERIASQTRTPGRSRSESQGSSSSGVASVTLGDNLSITADPATNSLIIIASRSDYERISKLLKEIDVKRRQVVVEAMILEVGVDTNRSIGTEFLTSTGGTDGGIFGSNNFGNFETLFSNPQQLQDFTLAAASAGTLTLPGGVTIPTHSVLLRAAEGNSDVNVLSAPTILATDNEQAEIVVGRNVPFISSTATDQTDLNNTFNQVDRQDVGITLRITPQISSSDFVTLQMFTEVSNVIPGTDSSTLGPTTTVRTSETTVITKDSQMVVIGGLMSDNVTRSERGIPFLKDIPFFGDLFQTTSEAQNRTNLLIFITPRIVQDQFDAHEFSLEKRDHLSEVIESYDIYPDRKDQLESEDFHNVIAGEVTEGVSPGTIRGEKKQANHQEFKKIVQPKLIESKKHIVLKLMAPLPSGVWPELFSQANVNQQLLAVRLPADVHARAEEFFQVGQLYAYDYNGAAIQMQVLAVFDQAGDALQASPNLSGEWYTLSAHEILGLGKGPWKSYSN